MIKSALLLLVAALAGAAATDPAQAVRQVLNDQQAAWNRGDLDAFATGYKDSPDILFVGHTVVRGYAGMLERYRKSYPTREKMGKLAFSDLEVRMLGTDYANVVGRFHLQRTAAGGGESAGVFTLLFERTPRGWKIIQDHTS